MKIVHGDLLKLALEGEFDVIVHGCNCQCAMGAGIAKGIKLLFPEAFAADCDTTKGERAKLGTYSQAIIERDGVGFVVVNAYTQFHWRGKKPLVEYGAVRSVFAGLKQEFSGKRFGYPRIGAGLAGGDWSRLATIIDQELTGEDHTLVEYQP